MSFFCLLGIWAARGLSGSSSLRQNNYHLSRFNDDVDELVKYLFGLQERDPLYVLMNGFLCHIFKRGFQFYNTLQNDLITILHHLAQNHHLLLNDNYSSTPSAAC